MSSHDLQVHAIDDATRHAMLDKARSQDLHPVWEVKDDGTTWYYVAFPSGRIVQLNRHGGRVPENILRLEGLI